VGADVTKKDLKISFGQDKVSALVKVCMCVCVYVGGMCMCGYVCVRCQLLVKWDQLLCVYVCVCVCTRDSVYVI